jgi:hypothetical protein
MLPSFGSWGFYAKCPIQTFTFSFGGVGLLPDLSGMAIGFLPRSPRHSW